MSSYVIAIDQSTQSTKAMLYTEDGRLLDRADATHQQHYPKPGWVEHDAMELYRNTLEVCTTLVNRSEDKDATYSLALTNQRETVVVWNRLTGEPVYNAVVWQCTRGAQICEELKAQGYTQMVQQKSGLLIDPYFAASGAKWILDNVKGARETAERGELMMGTIDSWLIYKLTDGHVHATDYTNASRTLLFNIHTLDWDDDLLRLFTIPRSMMPEARPCDACFGETTLGGLLSKPAVIAGVLGDSHGALAGQMCFAEGLGKATYGTGSSVMVNIGEQYADAPDGLVTSVGFAALGRTFYAFEGNIHCTGATISWLQKSLGLIESAQEVETLARQVEDNGGVYLVPAFAGLGAPWWNADVKAVISGLTLGSTKAHVARAALESIACQVADLVNAMTQKAGVALREVRVDGGPTKNKLLMQLQADLLRVPVVRSEMEDASAFGAYVMNGFARKKWTSFEEVGQLWNGDGSYTPQNDVDKLYEGWQKAVRQILK